MDFNDSPHPEENELVTGKKMWETARMLVDIAIESQMKIYDVDRKTARDWVVQAAEAARSNEG